MREMLGKNEVLATPNLRVGCHDDSSAAERPAKFEQF